MKEWEEQFDEIVGDLVNLKQLTALTRGDLIRAIAGMNEVSAYLGHLLVDDEMEDEHPDQLAQYVRDIMELTNELAELLSTCDDPDCMCSDECPDCTDSQMCQDCIDMMKDDD